jgi:4-hydroxybenzoate polyprenyltransferase
MNLKQNTEIRPTFGKTSRLVKKGVEFFVYSNLFISLCAAAYTAKTSLLLYGNNGSFQTNAMVFCATLFFYCFHRVNKKNFLSPEENLEERNKWMSTHKYLYFILIAVSLLGTVTDLLFLPFRIWPVYIPAALLALGYTFPIIPTRKRWKRLRDINWLKTLWIAFAFSWLTTFLPVFMNESISYSFQPGELFIFARAFLFIFAICLPFDIRDINFDKQKGVHTLPVSLGIKISIYISLILLLSFLALVTIQFFFFGLGWKPASALTISAILTLLLIPLAKTRRPALLFPLLYDGAMLIQWILLFAFIRS